MVRTTPAGSKQRIRKEKQANQLKVRTNDEQASQGSTVHLIILISDQHTIVSRDSLGGISHQGNGKSADTTLVSGGSGPSQMSVVRVSGDGQDLSVDGSEIAGVLTEGDNLSLKEP